LNKSLKGSKGANLEICDLDEALDAVCNFEDVMKMKDLESKGDYSTAKLKKVILIREAIKKVKAIHQPSGRPHKRILFISSDFEDMKDNFKASSICVAVPSAKLHK